MKQYGVSAMPTLVIADNKEKTLVKQVGAPFSTVADASKWFENIASALKDVSDLEAKHSKDAKDVDVSLKLAETYLKLSRLADAAYLSAQAGDKETARKELKAVVEAGPADHQWVDTAKKVLEELDGEGK